MTLYSMDGVCKDHLEETVNTVREVFLSVSEEEKVRPYSHFLGLSKIRFAFKEFLVGS